MNNYVFRSHPITLFYLLRSWWFVFTAPIVRIVLQRIISSRAQPILLSEAVLLLFATIISTIGWFSTEIIVTDGHITIKRGVFVKRRVFIGEIGLWGVSIVQNPIYHALGCARCGFISRDAKDIQC